MSKEQIYKKTIYDVTSFVEMFDISETEYAKARIQISKIANKKIRNNYDNEISMKELFSEYDFSTKDWYDNQNKIISEKTNKMLIENKETINEFTNRILVTNDFKVSFSSSKLSPFTKKISREYDDREFQKLLNNRYRWAKDSIMDFIDIKQEFSYLFHQESTNTLNWKMLFKESFSLLDRLKTEAGLHIFEKLSSDEEFSQNDKDSVLKFRDKYNWNIAQDLIANDMPHIVDSSKVVFSDFKIDDEGWLKFKLKKFEPFEINKYNNLLIYDLSTTRNLFEHSYSTEFQQYFDSKGININTNVSNFRFQISEHWKMNITLVMMVFIYQLDKLNLYIKHKKYI